MWLGIWLLVLVYFVGGVGVWFWFGGSMGDLRGCFFLLCIDCKVVDEEFDFYVNEWIDELVVVGYECFVVRCEVMCCFGDFGYVCDFCFEFDW